MFLALAIVLGLLTPGAHAAQDGVWPIRWDSDRDPAWLALDRFARGARLIGISESAHGSSELTRAQVLLIQRWVERAGLRVIFFEGGVTQFEPISEYVRTCRGDLDHAVKRFYTPDQSMKSLLVWLCRYNQVHPQHPVSVRGVDVWDRPWDHYDRLAALSELPELTTVRAHCWGANLRDWSGFLPLMKILMQEKKIPDSDYVPCMSALDQIDRSLRAQRRSLESRHGRRAYADARMASATLRGWIDNFHTAYQPFADHWRPRDLAMATNLMWAWTQEGSAKRAVFIGHNSHVFKSGSEADWWKTGSAVLPTAGSFLHAWLGSGYRALAMTGYDVDGSQGDFTTPTAEDSLDRALHEQGRTMALVDARGRFVRSRDRWWVHNENSAEDYTNGVWIKPEDHFDALWFFDRSAVADLIERDQDIWEPTQPPKP